MKRGLVLGASLLIGLWLYTNRVSRVPPAPPGVVTALADSTIPIGSDDPDSPDSDLLPLVPLRSASGSSRNSATPSTVGRSCDGRCARALARLIGKLTKSPLHGIGDEGVLGSSRRGARSARMRYHSGRFSKQEGNAHTERTHRAHSRRSGDVACISVGRRTKPD